MLRWLVFGFSSWLDVAIESMAAPIEHGCVFMCTSMQGSCRDRAGTCRDRAGTVQGRAGTVQG